MSGLFWLLLLILSASSVLASKRFSVAHWENAKLVYSPPKLDEKVLQQPLFVVGVLGPHRCGKSFLMNRLIELFEEERDGYQPVFDVQPTLQAVTKGLWLYISSAKVKMHDGTERYLAFFDSEGSGAATDKLRQLNATRVALLVDTLSNLAIFNVMGTLQASNLAHLADIFSYSDLALDMHARASLAPIIITIQRMSLTSASGSLSDALFSFFSAHNLEQEESTESMIGKYFTRLYGENGLLNGKIQPLYGFPTASPTLEIDENGTAHEFPLNSLRSGYLTALKTFKDNIASFGALDHSTFRVQPHLMTTKTFLDGLGALLTITEDCPYTTLSDIFLHVTTPLLADAKRNFTAGLEAFERDFSASLQMFEQTGDIPEEMLEKDQVDICESLQARVAQLRREILAQTSITVGLYHNCFQLARESNVTDQLREILLPLEETFLLKTKILAVRTINAYSRSFQLEATNVNLESQQRCSYLANLKNQLIRFDSLQRKFYGCGSNDLVDPLRSSVYSKVMGQTVMKIGELESSFHSDMRSWMDGFHKDLKEASALKGEMSRYSPPCKKDDRLRLCISAFDKRLKEAKERNDELCSCAKEIISDFACPSFPRIPPQPYEQECDRYICQAAERYWEKIHNRLTSNGKLPSGFLSFNCTCINCPNCSDIDISYLIRQALFNLTLFCALTRGFFLVIVRKKKMKLGLILDRGVLIFVLITVLIFPTLKSVVELASLLTPPMFLNYMEDSLTIRNSFIRQILASLRQGFDRGFCTPLLTSESAFFSTILVTVISLLHVPKWYHFLLVGTFALLELLVFPAQISFYQTPVVSCWLSWGAVFVLMLITKATRDNLNELIRRVKVFLGEEAEQFPEDPQHSANPPVPPESQPPSITPSEYAVAAQVFSPSARPASSTLPALVPSSATSTTPAAPPPSSDPPDLLVSGSTSSPARSHRDNE